MTPLRDFLYDLIEVVGVIGGIGSFVLRLLTLTMDQSVGLTVDFVSGAKLRNLGSPNHRIEDPSGLLKRGSRNPPGL